MNLSSEDLQSRLRQNTDLGHAKRNKAFLRQVKQACRFPGITLAQASGKKFNNSMADLISLYRFEENDIEIGQLRTIRDKVVAESIPVESEILIVHDVTLLDYTRHRSKKDRRPIGDHRGMGYEYMASLAVEPERGEIVGLVHETLVNESGPDDDDVMDYDYESLFSEFSAKDKQKIRSNHRHQMAVHINGLAKKLPGRRMIHVGDREFDDVFIVGRCQPTGSNFVIRTDADRNVQVPNYDWIPQSALRKKQTGHPVEPGWVCVQLREIVPAVPVRPYKTLWIDADNRVTDNPNSARKVKLYIGTCSVRLYRTAKRNNEHIRTPAPLLVNMVVVRELNPPANAKPLCWILFTSLPVDTHAQQDQVARFYQLRWKIETYFRLLKSGYHIEAYRLENGRKIAKLLVILSLAAMVIMNLKVSLGLPAQGSLSDEQYRMVKKAISGIDNPDPKLSLEWRLFALVLKLGGWLGRRNDPIGPAKLMRGILLLLAALDVSQLHPLLLNQAARNRDTIEKMFG